MLSGKTARKAGNIKKYLIISAIAAIIIWILIPNCCPKFSPYEVKLRNAKVLKIKEEAISIGKAYNIYVEGEKVASVTGKFIKKFGDTFTLTTKDGKTLCYEKEHKRFLRLNRTASCYSGKGRLTGYIGEETVHDLFSISYIFHIYDKNKHEIGKSKKLGKSCINRHKLYGADSSTDYEINKRFIIFGGDDYILTVLDKESTIPLEYAILMVCIEDVIGDNN